jgi:predicted nucleic acid-binding protein
VRIVVCDTRPILHLWEATAPELLGRAGEVIMPPAVDRELESRLPRWPIERPEWLRTESLPEDVRPQVAAWAGVGGLGPGEIEAIVLARVRRADWLLTDDAGARLIASFLGLEAHGSLGVVLWAAVARHLDRQQAGATLERRARTSLWISPAVLQEARRARGALAP